MRLPPAQLQRRDRIRPVLGPLAHLHLPRPQLHLTRAVTQLAVRPPNQGSVVRAVDKDRRRPRQTHILQAVDHHARLPRPNGHQPRITVAQHLNARAPRLHHPRRRLRQHQRRTPAHPPSHPLLEIHHALHLKPTNHPSPQRMGFLMLSFEVLRVLRLPPHNNPEFGAKSGIFGKYVIHLNSPHPSTNPAHPAFARRGALPQRQRGIRARGRAPTTAAGDSRAGARSYSGGGSL